MIRPALASALATVTDRPVGHWIAELKSPAFRGGWTIERYGGPRLCWLVEADFGRATTHRRGALLTIADPAEALEALVTRGVLPMAWVDDSARTFDVSASVEIDLSLVETPVRCRDGFEVVVTTGLAPSDLAQMGTVTLCRGDRRLTAKIHLGDEPERVFREMLTRWPEPASLLDLLAWASLGPAQIEQAEELAREAVRWLAPWGVEKRDRRIVWRVAARTDDLNRFVWGDDEHRLHADGGVSHAMPHSEGGGRSWFVTNPLGWCSPATALWDMGLALDAIDGDALVLVCPPLQGEVHRG